MNARSDFATALPELEAVTWTIDRGDAGVRLDRVMARRVAGRRDLSRTRLQQLIELGHVSVNGSPVTKVSARVPAGASIEARLPPEPARRAPAAQPLPLDVLLEDEHLLAVNKRAGIVVHPSYKHAAATLLNAVLWHLAQQAPTPDGAGQLARQPRLVHRLDKDTSGVLLLSKTRAAHAAVGAAARAGRVRKEYLAIVHGQPRPKRGTIDLPLARDAHDRRRVMVAASGRPSLTRFERLASFKSGRCRLSLVRCELVTGRTHQIRVHLAASGWPILGDRVYGPPSMAAGASAQPGIHMTRQALHAWKLSFPHPATGSLVTIVAPVPDDFLGVLSKAGNFERMNSVLPRSI